MSPECVQCGQQLTGHRIAGGSMGPGEYACSTKCRIMYVHDLDETEAEGPDFSVAPDPTDLNHPFPEDFDTELIEEKR